MRNFTEQIQKIFKGKKERRKSLGALPIAEKFQIVTQMQRLAAPILQARGIERSVWMTGPISDVKIVLDKSAQIRNLFTPTTLSGHWIPILDTYSASSTPDYSRISFQFDTNTSGFSQYYQQKNLK